MYTSMFCENIIENTQEKGIQTKWDNVIKMETALNWDSREIFSRISKLSWISVS